MKSGVLLCCLLSLELLGSRRHFFGVCRRRSLFCIRFCFNPIWAVKARTVSVHILGKRVIDIGVVNDGLVHVRYSGVVLEVVSIPSSAPIAISGVAVTVINAAVKTDMRSPVTLVKDIRAVVPAPPCRGPKQTDGRRSNPHPRHPIISVVIPPVSRSPNVALGRSRRLLIYRQLRRSDAG